MADDHPYVGLPRIEFAQRSLQYLACRATTRGTRADANDAVAKRKQHEPQGCLDVRQQRSYSVVERQGITWPEPTHMSDRAELLQGTLNLLVLKSLLLAPLHGWGISKRIRQLSGDVLQVNQGSLYPALYRLEDRGWIEAEWGVSPEGRRAKFYRLTKAGRRQFAEERAGWRNFSAAVEQVLNAT